jgi:replicative DNA helicase
MMDPDSGELPPHDPAAERGILGCILLAPGECIDTCVDSLPAPEAFYELRNRRIYQVMLELHEQGTAPDVITMASRLAGEEIAYASGLVDEVPSAANLAYYLDAVVDKFARRRVLQAASAATLAAKSDEPIEAVLGAFERDAMSVLDRRTETTISGRTLADTFIGDAQECHARAGKLQGFSYGLHDLDKITGGMHPRELVIVGARPSIGKTAFGGTVCLHSTVLGDTPVPTLFVSLEMPAKAILRRLGCGLSGVPLSLFRTGGFQERHFGPMTAAAKRLKDAPLWIDYTPGGLTASRLRALIRRHARKHGVELVVIDYLQKVRPDTRHEMRTYELGSVVEDVKAEAVRSNIAIMALAQLSRKAEGRRGNADSVTPSMADLSDSKQIEQEADVIILLDRNRSEPKGEATLLIEKQRDGECGIVSSFYDGTLCRFYPARQEERPAVESMEDHP